MNCPILKSKYLIKANKTVAIVRVRIRKLNFTNKWSYPPLNISKDHRVDEY